MLRRQVEGVDRRADHPPGYPSAATSEAAAGDGDGEPGGSFLCGIFSFLSLTLTNHKFHEGFFFEKVS